MNGDRTIISSVTCHIGNRIHLHHQFIRHDHITTIRVGTDTICELHCVVIARVIDIGQGDHQRILVVCRVHHIRMRPVVNGRERPRHRGLVVHHPTELSLQNQITIIGTTDGKKFFRIDGNRRLNRDTHFHHQITSGLADTVGSHHMIGQLHVASRGVNETGIMNGSLVFIMVVAHILNAINRIDIRGSPRIASSVRNIHHRKHIKSVAFP